MKKLFAVLLGLGLSFGLVACGDDEEKNDGVEDNTGADTTPEDNNTGTDTTPEDDNTGGDSVVQAGTVLEAINTTSGSTVKIQGVVSLIHYGMYNNALDADGIYLTDATGTIYVYSSSLAKSVVIGDEIVIDGTRGAYNGFIQVSSATISQVLDDEGKDFSLDAMISDVTAEELAASFDGSTSAKVYKITMTVRKNSYGAYYLENDNGTTLALYASDSRTDLGYPEFEFLAPYLDSEITVAYIVNGTNYNADAIRGHILKVLSV